MTYCQLVLVFRLKLINHRFNYFFIIVFPFKHFIIRQQAQDLIEELILKFSQILKVSVHLHRFYLILEQHQLLIQNVEVQHCLFYLYFKLTFSFFLAFSFKLLLNLIFWKLSFRVLLLVQLNLFQKPFWSLKPVLIILIILKFFFLAFKEIQKILSI